MTWTRKHKTDAQFMRDLDRGFLRSSFRSIFWAVFITKKRESGITLTRLAKEVGTSKSVLSRWFSGDPNWTINTIADLADALDVDLEVRAIDRRTGQHFSPSGESAARVQAETKDTPSFVVRTSPYSQATTG